MNDLDLATTVGSSGTAANGLLIIVISAPCSTSNLIVSHNSGYNPLSLVCKDPKLSKYILTFEKAGIEKGGDGAFYIYLRKKKT